MMRPCSVHWDLNRSRCDKNISVSMGQRILEELANLEAHSCLRHLEIAYGTDFSSNDYLGLATDPRMKLAILESVNSASRIASAGSRLLSGHDEIWTAIEEDF